MEVVPALGKKLQVWGAYLYAHPEMNNKNVCA